MKKCIFCVVAGLATMLVGLGTLPAQGTIDFQNLDFEFGVFVAIGGNPQFVEPVPALPGWTAYVGTNLAPRVLHNSLSFSTAEIAIQGPDDPSPNWLHGAYFVVLQAGNDIYSGQGMVGSALTQTGTLPIGTQSIRFLSNNPFVLLFSLSFGGNDIPLSNLGTSSNGRPIWGGDISTFAGQTGELRFQGAGYLDYIQFSSQPIPEPSALCLVGLGGLLVGWRWRRSG